VSDRARCVKPCHVAVHKSQQEKKNNNNGNNNDNKKKSPSCNNNNKREKILASKNMEDITCTHAIKEGLDCDV
jgi:hypothetical protein